MSRTLAAFVSLWDEEGRVVALSPGDELPGWAEGRVGDHCLTPVLEPNDVEDEPNEKPDDADSEDHEESTPDDPETGDEAEAVPEEPKPAAKPEAAAPDFTGSAPRRRQSRK
ncbi:hypothetical protein [Arthrobacter sp. Z1-15]